MHEKNLAKQNTYRAVIDKLYLEPIALITNANTRPKFKAGFFYNDNLIQTTIANESKNHVTTGSELIAETLLTKQIFQVYEDYLMALSSLKEHLHSTEFIVAFLRWSANPYIQQNFKHLKVDFNSNTQSFINLLFEYTNKIPTKDPKAEDYVQQAQNLLNDKRFNTLVQKAKM